MRQSKIFVLSILMMLSLLALNVKAQENFYRASIDIDGVQRVEIVGGSYYFDPEHIIVKVNMPVELIFRKMPGITPHNIIIEAPDAGIDFKVDMSKDPKTVKFTPAKTGIYAMYCDKRFLFFKNHRDKGMKGVLEVVE
ncbi:MAG: quinol oxidase [Thermodesulfovibrionia bacterium]|nr:quinol oxidase [Thermodesulfovibrionia bacterium]